MFVLMRWEGAAAPQNKAAAVKVKVVGVEHLFQRYGGFDLLKIKAVRKHQAPSWKTQRSLAILPIMIVSPVFGGFKL